MDRYFPKVWKFYTCEVPNDNKIYNILVKAMDQPEHVTSVIAIAVCKVIQKLLTKIDFWYQTKLLGSSIHVCLVPKIHFNYYFSNNLTYCNCNYRYNLV